MIFLLIITLILSTDYKEDLQKVEEDLQQSKEELETLKKKEGSILKEIERIEKEAEKERKKLAEIISKEKKTKGKIDLLSEGSLSIQEEIKKRQGTLDKGLLLLYIEISKEPFSSIVSCRETEENIIYLKELIRGINALIDSLSQRRDSLLYGKKIAQSELDELLVLKKKKKEAKDRIEAQKNEKSALLGNIKNKKESLSRLVEELEHSRKELEDMVKEMARGKSGKKGSFIFPVDGKIISKFGTVIDPVYGTKLLNNGIDIKAREGEKVGASASGRVVYADNFYGYGKTIIIDHENGYHTVYSHLLEINVINGEWVEKNETIGKVGSSGMTEEPILHFELRKDGKAIDPMNLLGK